MLGVDAARLAGHAHAPAAQAPRGASEHPIARPSGAGKHADLDLFYGAVRLIHLSHGEMIREGDERVAGRKVDLFLIHTLKLPQD
eukprot:scaffold191214_cov31-Tisochrysis_lutea.AAC.3